MFKKKLIIISAVLFFISLGMVYASDNVTDDSMSIDDSSDFEVIGNSSVADTHIETNNINSYYKEKSTFSGYLKDDDGNPIENKKLTISLNGKTYSRTTDADGRIKLEVNLKPNSYNAVVNFDGDDDYGSSNMSSVIKIKKASAVIKTSNFKTYVNSDLFFKVKVYNKVTNKPISGVKVLFKVYSLKTKKFTKYYAVTNKNGVAVLNKNLKVGSYIVYTHVKDKNVKYKRSKSTMTVLPTAEMGCCSIYVQVSDTDSICGFRRDSTYSADIYINTQNYYGRTAIKQYKNAGGYFFHLITTSDGWMIGTGGADSASINKKIECLAGRMVIAGKFDNDKLRSIRGYIQKLGIGHFAIKSPNGHYAIVWTGGYKFGRLYPGQFISVPNYQSCFRTGNYASFSSNPDTAALKILATDSFGINKRDIIIYHLTKTTKNYKTSSSVKVYGANDNGAYSHVGFKGDLKDNIYFKNTFHSKNSLPYPLGMKYLGSHSFGNIDRLVKIPTIIKAPEVSTKFNKTKYFKVFVKDSSQKPIKSVKIKVKVYKGSFTKYYTLKTDANGRALFNVKGLSVGTYNVLVMPANNKYFISAKSKFKIKA